ncbi:MAG TPA: UMP kinase [Candidatus Pacearchaeota archaeon]|nr:UMP kinase [Candidatus Pacearchaeota archaeon]
MKKVIVLSLGGSLIIPDNVDTKFLKQFKKIILKNSRKHKLLIGCGGGSIARKYISALRKEGLDVKHQSMAGISATRMNARFMSYFFDIDPKHGIPHDKNTLKKYSKTQDVVFFGALKYKPKQTSDSTAAEIARQHKTIFINLTNVKGLYDKDPKKHKNAKLIQEISWKDFDKMANASKYTPGQHFVLDQTASKIILDNKISTYIIGPDLKQLENVLKGKKFEGTLVRG